MRATTKAYVMSRLSLFERGRVVIDVGGEKVLASRVDIRALSALRRGERISLERLEKLKLMGLVVERRTHHGAKDSETLLSQ